MRKQVPRKKFPPPPRVKWSTSNPEERLSLDCQKVIGFALLGYTICVNTSHHVFIQSEVKPKPLVPRSHTTFSPKQKPIRDTKRNAVYKFQFNFKLHPDSFPGSLIFTPE